MLQNPPQIQKMDGFIWTRTDGQKMADMCCRVSPESVDFFNQKDPDDEEFGQVRIQKSQYLCGFADFRKP